MDLNGKERLSFKYFGPKSYRLYTLNWAWKSIGSQGNFFRRGVTYELVNKRASPHSGLSVISVMSLRAAHVDLMVLAKHRCDDTGMSNRGKVLLIKEGTQLIMSTPLHSCHLLVKQKAWILENYIEVCRVSATASSIGGQPLPRTEIHPTNRISIL